MGFLQVGNIEKAIGIFSELADKKHPSAMFNLALLYTHGHGNRLMLKEAPELFLAAAELGHEGAAKYFALFTQFQRGFSSSASLASLLQTVGDGKSALLIIHAIAADILLRLNDRARASLFVSQEIFDIDGGGGKGDEFVDLMGFNVLSFGEIWQDMDGVGLPDGSPEAMSANLRMTLESCVSNRGMTEETALLNGVLYLEW